MSPELSMVTELAIILMAAGIFTIISKALKQPLILGYIVAGFLVGPHLGLFPQLSSDAVHQWSELGIIFLLFGLGLEFSFKKLLKIGSSALIAAVVKCMGMFVLGIIVGNAMGWTMMESVFLGGLLSMSSTTIIIKAFTDMGLKDKPYSPLIFGSLVFEDLIAVLLMVLLSTMAVSNSFSGSEMLVGLAKLAFFLILWFLVGIYVIPLLLNKARRFLNDEILLLVSLGLCFGMVVLANSVGFSSALGAFVMGSILAETLEGTHIEHLTGNIKDLFGAIFFVSVGMMVNPAVIAEHWLPILILTLTTVVGHILFSSAGALLAGSGLDTSVHSGFALSQLGEFGFIIAGLGCSLGVMRDFIYPVVIAVAVITTFITPYMIRLADPSVALLRRKLPRGILVRIDPSDKGPGKKTRVEQSEWRRLIKALVLRTALYGVILVAVILGSKLYLEPLVVRLFPSWSGNLRSIAVVAVTLAVMSPFLYGIAVNGQSLRDSAEKLMKDDARNRWPVLSLIFIRIFIAMGFVISLLLAHFRLNGWALLLIVLAGVVFFIMARGSVHKFTRLEDRFLANFNEREDHERRSAPVTTSVREKMAGYDVHLETVTVSPDFAFVGRSLREMPFRHVAGVNILKIQRGSRSILIPAGGEVIYPSDKLLAVGTSGQIEAFRKAMQDNLIQAEPDSEGFLVEPVTLIEESGLVGKTLRTADMRTKGCMVISVMKGDELITNPAADYKFETGDIVWLAGLVSSVNWYK